MEFFMTNLQTITNIIPFKPVQLNQLNQPAKAVYKIELVSKISDCREQVEAFVQTSYYNNFSAQLRSYFPLYLAVSKVSDNSLIGALGLRYADGETLFSECYLPNPIEKIIKHHEHCDEKLLDRKKIIELGNFVVRHSSDIKNVIPFISKYIKSLNVNWTVYTLTRPIKSYFDKLGIKLKFLNDAQIEAINDAADDWGNYYKFKPAVYYSSVKDNMNQA